MNDVLNSQGYTQAAWWNRIPTAAWALMGTIGICCNLLIGYCSRRIEARPILFIVVPLVVSISFSLIADIDSPRGGVIRVAPLNLVSLDQTCLQVEDEIGLRRCRKPFCLRHPSLLGLQHVILTGSRHIETWWKSGERKAQSLSFRRGDKNGYQDEIVRDFDLTCSQRFYCCVDRRAHKGRNNSVPLDNRTVCRRDT